MRENIYLKLMPKGKKRNRIYVEGIIEVYTSPLWTLEYDILNSTNKTREYLLASILEAQLIKIEIHI